MAGPRRPLTPEDFQSIAQAQNNPNLQGQGQSGQTRLGDGQNVLTKTLDSGDEVVMTPGANASAAAQEAGERYRASRADDNRATGQDSREGDMRPVTWRPPSILPDIPPQEGWAFRWVRLSVRDVADDANINQALREGYVVATVEDIGNIAMSSDRSTRFPGGIEIGGLLLCKIPQEVREARERYYAEQAMSQVRGIENDMLRENDPRMPVLRPSVQSRTSFGANQSR